MLVLKGFVGILPFLLASAILLHVYRFFSNHLTKFNDREEMKKGTIAVALSRGGGYFGIGLAALGSLIRQEDDYLGKLTMFSLDGVFAITVIIIASWAIDWAVLRGIENDEHIVDNNKAVAWVDFCMQTTLGLIMLGSFAGGGQGFWEGMGSAAFFAFLALGIVVLIYKVYQFLWVKVAECDIDGEVAKGNLAAAIDVGTLMLGMGFTLMFSIIGDSEGWWTDITSFVIAFGSSILAVVVGRLLGLTLAFAGTSNKYGRHHGNVAKSTVVGVVGVSAGILAGLVTFL